MLPFLILYAVCRNIKVLIYGIIIIMVLLQISSYWHIDRNKTDDDD